MFAVCRAFQVRCAPSSGSSIPFRQASRNGATETVTARPPSWPLRKQRSGSTSSPSAPPMRISRSSRISACTRAPPRVAPAPIQCARPESVIPSQNANAARFCSGSYPSPTTPSTARVSLRTFATWRGTGTRSDWYSRSTTASNGCCSTRQSSPAAAIISAALCAACGSTARTTSPHVAGPEPNHSGARASSIRCAGCSMVCMPRSSSRLRRRSPPVSRATARPP